MSILVATIIATVIFGIFGFRHALCVIDAKHALAIQAAYNDISCLHQQVIDAQEQHEEEIRKLEEEVYVLNDAEQQALHEVMDEQLRYSKLLNQFAHLNTECAALKNELEQCQASHEPAHSDC